MRKTLFILLLLPLLATTMQAQQKTGSGSKFDWDRLTYGGSIWPQFGQGYTLITIAPLVGYRVTDRLIPGIYLNYTYISQRTSLSVYNEKTNILGLNPFVRYYPVKFAFLHSEFEMLKVKDEIPGLGSQKFGQNNFFIGAGFTQGFGSSGVFGRGAYIMALYNLTYDAQTSVYGSPLVFRAGFMF